MHLLREGLKLFDIAVFNIVMRCTARGTIRYWRRILNYEVNY